MRVKLHPNKNPHGTASGARHFHGAVRRFDWPEAMRLVVAKSSSLSLTLFCPPVLGVPVEVAVYPCAFQTACAWTS